MDEKQKQTAINILTFWHQSEFFNCIDLNDISQDKSGTIHYKIDDLNSDPECLPWLNRENIRRAGRNYFPNLMYTYSIYLGIFEKSEFFENVKQFFEFQEEIDWDERKQDNGLTCSASMKVDKNGILMIDSLELSTAPWALGQVLKGNINNIRFSDFDTESRALIQNIHAIGKLAANIKQEAEISQALTTFEIYEILKLIGNWAGFDPKKVAPIIIVKLNKAENDSDQPRNNQLTHEAVAELKNISQQLKVHLKEKNKETSDLHEDSNLESEDYEEKTIPILNSFFLRDIERARDLLQQNKLHDKSPLITYLSSKVKYHPDILSQEGESIIRKLVTLDNTPLGRWPSDSSHSMSLMQQFAINTIEKKNDKQRLFSVNGPPGTGKTTMLRDIVASNIVKRAKIIASLEQSVSAFSKDLNVKIGTEIHSDIKQLIPELTGFEMVVVSNNNSAVENISKELPQIQSLGKEFSKIAYLKPVAQKLAAKHTVLQKKTTIHSLSEKDDCWGLIAAALGNTGNRKEFNDKIQFKPIQHADLNGEQAKGYRTIAPAIKELAAQFPDTEKHFKSTQLRFTQAERKVKEVVAELEELESVIKSERDLIHYKNKVEQLWERQLHTKYCLSKIKLKNVTWWNLLGWINKRMLISQFKLRVENQKAQYESKQAKYKRLEDQLHDKKLTLRPLFDKYGDVVFSEFKQDLNDIDVQRKAFGQCEILNQARSNLSVIAFELHQAWLVAVYDGCFSRNVNQFHSLIMGKVTEYEHAKAMWQCFFMVVPVISSAFASVANQFSQLRVGDIGWLFIDEAGQATPQQAVGALLRAKHAIVVGDPLQVEPVFTTPPEVIEYFGKQLLGEQWYRWSPTVASVQTVADQVNPFGTKKIAKGKWLGSPLRVHRRCKDPMFSISNEIAYNNKMLHGSDKICVTGQFVWGESQWLDVSGEISGKHYVPKQGKRVLQMLLQYVEEHGELPDCYMISPFKDVKNQLKRFLKNNFSHQKIPKTLFSNWIDDRVGTVHTFQGKEEKYVIMVLGVSTEKSGPADWASSKPNLLNVAVTRAKTRIYIIGCKRVWSTLNYFSEACFKLPSSDKV